MMFYQLICQVCSMYLKLYIWGHCTVHWEYSETDVTNTMPIFKWRLCVSYVRWAMWCIPSAFKAAGGRPCLLCWPATVWSCLVSFSGAANHVEFIFVYEHKPILVALSWLNELVSNKVLLRWRDSWVDESACYLRKRTWVQIPAPSYAESQAWLHVHL